MLIAGGEVYGNRARNKRRTESSLGDRKRSPGGNDLEAESWKLSLKLKCYIPGIGKSDKFRSEGDSAYSRC